MNEMEKAYEPGKFEDSIYAAWEASGFFNPDKLPGSRKEPFSIVLPPPNVTGTLHVGHAVMLALQDLMVRFERMRGRLALWIPGTDHAAIATQTKVEKLLKKQGQSRYSLGKEKFLKEVLKFAEESKTTIRKQMRKMGSSCDWSREAYTLDEERSKAVRTVFKMMHDDGLIYRGNRVVNWCPRCASTLADDEVQHEPRKAELWTFKYGKDFPIAIATTRPETKLGDTAVAVNPKDARYKKYVGQTFEVDFVGTKLKLVVVADPSIDSEFGTGAVGVTPAHSAVDALLAEKHNISSIQIIGEDGKMLKTAGEAFTGLTVSEARDKVLARLKDAGLLQKTEEVEQNVATCYRCNEVIEPLPKLQWFIGVNKEFSFRQSERNPIKGLKNGERVTLKRLMQHVVKNGEIKILPERFVKTYFHWIDNLRDWNISRQIWFGHQVPVWYKGDKMYVGAEMPKGEGWSQDSDTLDTWFSSGLWTFSTLGWPKDNKDLRTYHPTAVMETGYDILFFWIARMILMSTYALGEVPFRTVYLHGLVRDVEGRKMSKSLGNIIDPLDVSAKYGTDAVRLSLILGSSPGGDAKIWDEKIAGFRNFTNKLWNISRYVLATVGKDGLKTAGRGLPEPVSLSDKWILSRLAAVAASVTKKLEDFEFSGAGEELRDFTWSEFADWYLEASKIQINSGSKEAVSSAKEILAYVLRNILKLWHPFMPFVTEAVWQNTNAAHGKDFLMVEEWPQTLGKEDKAAVRDFEKIKEVVTLVRNMRAEQKVDPKTKLDIYVSAGAAAKILENESETLRSLSRAEKLNFLKKAIKPKGAVGGVVGSISVFVHMGEADTASRALRLHKDLEEAERYLAMLKAKLGNKDFISRAPKPVIEAEKAKLAAQKEKVEKLKQELKS